MFGIFESMTFLFPQVGIFPKQPKTNRQKYQGLLNKSWRLRELPGTRVRHDLPGYAKPGIPPQLQLWNMQDEELKEHAGRLQESSEVGPCISSCFSRKNGRWMCFLQTGDVCLKKYQEMCLHPRKSLSHYVCIYIYISCKLCDYVYINTYSTESYTIIFHNIPLWSTITPCTMIYHHDNIRK